MRHKFLSAIAAVLLAAPASFAAQDSGLAGSAAYDPLCETGKWCFFRVMPDGSTPVTVIANTGGGGAVTQGTTPWVTNDPGLPDTTGIKTAALSTSFAPASDANIARETGGNLATIKTDLDSILTNTTGLATAAAQATGNTNTGNTATSTAAIATATGAQADAAYTSGSGSIIAILKGLFTNTTGLATAANQSTSASTLSTVATNTGNSASADGTTADSAYAGSGSASIISILKGVYTKLGTTLNVSIQNATLAVTQSGVWTTARSWTLASGTDSVTTVPSGTQAISAASLPLPTGAATSANQPTLVSGRVPTDGSGVTQPVSIAATVSTNTDNVADAVAVAMSAASAVVLTGGPVATAGYAVVDVDVTTMSATSITPQASFDNGATYRAVSCRSLSAGSSSNTPPAASITAVGAYECPAGDHFQLLQVGAGSTAASALKKRFGTAVPYAPISVTGVGASGTTDGGSPIKTGGKYNSTSLQLTNGQRGDTQIDANAAAVVTPNAVFAARWNYAAATSGISNTTTAVTIKAAAASGLRNCVTNIQISSDALATATEFAIRDGAGGTVLWRTKIGTSGYVNGYSAVFEGAPICGTAATLLEVVTLTATVTGSVYFNSQGYIAP